MYKTKDLYLAAVLKTIGHKIKDVVGEEGHHKYFLFAGNEKEVKEDEARFYNNEVKGMFKELCDNVQTLKDWISAKSRQGNY